VLPNVSRIVKSQRSEDFLELALTDVISEIYIACIPSITLTPKNGALQVYKGTIELV
jgi:hypothetical protein